MTVRGVNANNVVVALAGAWIQPWDEDVPAVLPADTLEYQGDWSTDPSGAWQMLGATDQGWELDISTKTSEINIEEQSTPVAVLADSKSVAVSGSLAESALQNLLWAYGGGVITSVAASSGHPGTSTLTLQDDLQIWAMGVETKNTAGFYRRFLIPKLVIAGDTKTTFRRAADKQMYPFTGTSICPPTDIKVTDMLTVALP